MSVGYSFLSLLQPVQKQVLKLAFSFVDKIVLNK